MSEGANAGTTSLIQPGLPALEWRLNQENLYSSKMMIRPPGRPRNSCSPCVFGGGNSYALWDEGHCSADLFGVIGDGEREQVFWINRNSHSLIHSFIHSFWRLI